MATTQKGYKQIRRNPRYTTQLNTFNTGMYLTNQTEPEGFAKYLVNYDVDATGSHIKPRRGKRVTQRMSLAPLATRSLPIFHAYVYKYEADYNQEIAGDLNNDRVLGIADISKYNQYLAGKITLTPQEQAKADVDGDGVITNTDMQYVYNKYRNNGNPTGTAGTVLDLRDRTDFVDFNLKEVVETKDCLVNPNGDMLVYDEASKSFLPAPNLQNKYNIDTKTFKTTLIKNVIEFDKDVATNKDNSLLRHLYTVTNNEIYSINEYKKDNTTVKELFKLVLANKNGEGSYSVFVPLKKKELNPLEAASSGYNMLLDEPYKFKDSTTGSFNIIGLLDYNSDDEIMNIPLLTANIGQSLKSRVYYQTSSTVNVQYTVSMRDLDSYYDVFEDVITDAKVEDLNGSKEWTINIVPKYDNTQVRIEAAVLKEDGSVDQTTATTFIKTIRCNNGELAKYQLRNIDILDCKGMISWFGYTGVYGVKEAPDTIFFSDIENPGYFPFPNNALTFDNNILAVHNYLDFLIVVTVDSLYIVSIGSNIMSSTIKKVMDNIYIPEIDARNLVVLKDQIFFKDADQFYVLKPNNYTSDATDLKNYVISTAIDNFTKNFTEETVKLLNEVYKTTNQELTRQLRRKINIVDFDVEEVKSAVLDEDVHYIFTIKPKYNATYNKESILIGDVSGDGVIRSNDSLLIGRYLAGLYSFNERQMIAADTDGDGVITENDSLMISKYLVGLDDIGFVNTYKTIQTTEDIYLKDVESTGTFTFEPGELELHLVYNTLTRAWRIHINSAGKETNILPDDSKLLGASKISGVYWKNKQTGNYHEFFIVQDPDADTTGLKEDTTSDMFHANLNTLVSLENTYEVVSDNFTLAPRYDNIKLSRYYEAYTYLDTGNIAIDDVYTKRWREVQLKLLNAEHTKIPFHTTFELDGQARIDSTCYEIQHITDIDDPDYGLIYITPIEVNNLNLYGDSCLADTETNEDYWAIDLSRFPDLTCVNVRFQLQGRGRRAKLKLLNTSLKRYELADINWVYRIMDAR